MIHPHTQLVQINETVGVGLIATEFIPKGTITWVKDPLDQMLFPDAFDALPPSTKKMAMEYSYETVHGYRLLCWDDARFMNHSCDCNCYITPWDFEIAIRDIAPGEQLTNDYGGMFLVAEELFDCKCGAAQCRGRALSRIQPEGLMQMSEHYSAAFAGAIHQAQALRDLFHLNPKLAEHFQIGHSTRHHESTLEH